VGPAGKPQKIPSERGRTENISKSGDRRKLGGLRSSLVLYPSWRALVEGSEGRASNRAQTHSPQPKVGISERRRKVATRDVPSVMGGDLRESEREAYSFFRGLREDHEGKATPKIEKQKQRLEKEKRSIRGGGGSADRDEKSHPPGKVREELMRKGGKGTRLQIPLGTEKFLGGEI